MRFGVAGILSSYRDAVNKFKNLILCNIEATVGRSRDANIRAAGVVQTPQVASNPVPTDGFFGLEKRLCEGSMEISESQRSSALHYV